jgi:UDP-N-acetylglucosamine 2-epimerase (non-hydrolysing)
MQQSYLIITDSGDIQEEARSLGKPVLLTSDATEPSELIDAGTIKLVGTDTDHILRECTRFLDDPSYYLAFSNHCNPYGEGQASQCIVAALLR